MGRKAEIKLKLKAASSREMTQRWEGTQPRMEADRPRSNLHQVLELLPETLLPHRAPRERAARSRASPHGPQRWLGEAGTTVLLRARLPEAWRERPRSRHPRVSRSSCCPSRLLRALGARCQAHKH